MLHEYKLEVEFFARLADWDAKIAQEVAAARCSHCRGPLHQGNYRRKPRGGLLATMGEAFALRHSLCCGHCRKRALPPSLRFLGRRVYLEVVVLLASMLAAVATALTHVVRSSGVPRRTLRRWGAWWTTTFPASPTWAELRAQFEPPTPAEARLPASLLDRLRSTRCSDREAASSGEVVVTHAARLLAPITTTSVVDGARFLRGIGPPVGTA
jgi:hypothetical protein